MTQAESQTRDLLNAISDQPVTFTISGVECIGMRGALTYPDKLMDGGFIKDYDLSLVTTLQAEDEAGQLADRFTSVPENGVQVTVSSIVYEIIKVTKDHLDVAVQFDLANAIK